MISKMYLPLSPDFEYQHSEYCFTHIILDALLAIYTLVVFTLAVGLFCISHIVREFKIPRWTLWYIALIQSCLILHIFAIIYLVKFRNV